TLPLLSGSQRFGMLIVEFILGERIMPDTLLTARALAQLVASVLDHDRLARERARLSSTVAHLRSENTNLETAIIQAAHELRGPLTIMRLGSQLAERHLRLGSEEGTPSDPPNTDLARAMSAATLANQNIDRAERLLTDLTDMARVRAGRLEIRPTRCDLATSIGKALAGLRDAWPTRRVHLNLPGEAEAA